MQNNVYHILGQHSHWQINKKIARNVGLDAALLLSDLISKRQYFYQNGDLVDGWFFNTQENIEIDTSLSEFQQRKAHNALSKAGFLSVKKMGIPARNFFYIHDDMLLKYLTTSDVKIKPLETEKLNHSINKNKEIKIKKENTPYIPQGGVEVIETLFEEQSKVSKRKERKTLGGENLAKFEKFYELYGKKIGRTKAEESWMKLTEKEVETVLSVVETWVKVMVKDKQFQPHPATWLNGKRFNDDLGFVSVPVETLVEQGKPLSLSQRQEMSDIYRKKYGVTYYPPQSTEYMAPTENVLSGKWWVDPSGFLHNATSSKMNWAVYKSIDGNYPGGILDKGWIKTR